MKRIIAGIAAAIVVAIPTVAVIAAEPVSNAWRGGYGDWPV